MKFVRLSVYSSIFVLATIWMVFAALFVPSPEKARLQSLQFMCTDFQKAEALALEDFSKGIYHIALSGEKYSSERSFILDSILRADYQVRPLYTGCIGTTEEVEHYMFVMAFQLANEYGHDFFDRALKARNAEIHPDNYRDGEHGVCAEETRRLFWVRIYPLSCILHFP